MPLVVPALRFFVVFLNVYETFKTLKPPPPSARRGGQPSPRAVSQRKRDLKGCLAVWVVWCCYAVYERTFDRVVSIFLPFYSEIKSVFLLFLVLTRAKGAEPLFLHVLRPLVKPYAVVVDPMLELSRDIGDFSFALLQVPLDYILSSPWFPSWCTGKLQEEPRDESSSGHVSSTGSKSSTHSGSRSGIPIVADHGGAARPSRVLNGRRESNRSVSDNQDLNGRPSVDNPSRSRASHDRNASTTSLPAYSELPFHDLPRYSHTLSRHSGHQIRYPPASAYPTSAISTLDLVGTAPEYRSPEWRSYPAFPSAYPPTPLPVSASLPNSAITRSSNDHRTVSDPAYPPIPEDHQGFGEALGRVQEGYPGSVHSSSSTSNILPGVNSYEESSDATPLPHEDTLLDDSMCSSEAGLSEDDFGTSLRTPHRFPESMPSTGYSSVDSLTSPLRTTGNTFSLRSKTSSDSESSESSFLAGRKRTHGAYEGKPRSTLPMSHSQNATLRGKPALPPLAQDPLQSSTSEGEDESGDNYGSTVAKRQKVLEPLRRKSTVRPATRGVGNARKGTSLSRSATVPSRPVTAASQGTIQTRSGSTAINSTVRGRKPTPASRHLTRGGSQRVMKSSSTSSSQSGTWRARAY